MDPHSTGERVSRDGYAGKPAVINVWGSWCPGCIAEAEDLRRFAEDHPEVQVIGVDLQDRQHRIVSRIVGETDYAGFEQGLEAAVAES